MMIKYNIMNMNVPKISLPKDRGEFVESGTGTPN
jgi:hypothetical protein